MEKSTLIGIIIFLVVILLGSLFFGFNLAEFKDKLPKAKGKKIIKVYIEPMDEEIFWSPQNKFDYNTDFWETRENVDFILVNSQIEADVPVKFVSEYEDNRLGRTEGKYVEIGLGDSKCNNKYYSYDSITTLDKIFIHELGHILKKEHSNNTADIMYPSFTKNYYFEVIDFDNGAANVSGILRGTCEDIMKANRQRALVD